MAEHSPIVLVGPTHPYTGGIAQHTTRLALELERAKIPVVVESWKAQYPKALYPGSGRIQGSPEVGIPATVHETLAWYSPLSWWRVGRRHRGSRIIVSIPTAFHALPYAVLRWGAGRTSEVWGIVHNVTPHDSGTLSRVLMGTMLRSLDHLIVHGSQAQEDARHLGVQQEAITVTALPSPWPEADATRRKKTSRPLRVVFFGTIRPYKGLAILLEALARVPHATLTIAGEFWESRAPYDELISRLGLTERVTIRAGYVPAEEFEELFLDADVMVLPYLRGTGSIVKEVGFRFGVPVIATRVGAISEGIEHDVNGLVIPPDSVDELANALQAASNPPTRARWQKAIQALSGQNTARWKDYVGAVTSA